MKNYKMEDLVPVVAKLSRKYTSNESSSISYENARKLMGAVIYCIDTYEKNAFSSNQILSKQKIPAEEAYQLGHELVILKVKEAKFCPL